MRSLLPGILAIFSILQPAHAQFSHLLRHLSSSPSGTNITPLALEARDIDLDGDPDVLASFPSGIYWYENDGQGHFSDGNAIDFQGEPDYKQAQFRDFDGDGVPDLAAGFGWRKNLGNGDFGPETGDFWREVSGSCDLNGDGLGDIMYHSTNVLFLERNLGAIFTPNGFPMANGSNIQVWLSADLDRNQREDVVASLASVLYWFKNEGYNRFTKIQIASGQIKTVAAGDVDGNGKMDLFAGVTNSVSWWEIDGYGNRTLRQTISMPGSNASTLTLGDLDGDNDLDLFTGGMTTPGGNLPAVLYFDAATGQFDPTPHTQPAFTSFCPNLVLADFDGNGRLDIAATQYSTGSRMAVFLDNGTPGNFNAPALAGEPLSYVNRLLPADLDGDGDRDLIAADYLIEKTNPGHYAQRRKINLPPLDVQLADLDADGLPDAVYPKSNTVSWQRNLGGLQFGPVIPIDGFVALNKHVGIADFDLDGDLDLCAGNGTGAPANSALLFWFENDGAGNFTKHQLLNDINWVLSTLPLDVNSDGLPDIYVEWGNGNSDIWFENLGNGAFGSKQNLFTAGTTEPVDINQRMITDLDGDGRSDLVFITDEFDTTYVFWYQNLGGNQFSDKKILHTEGHLGSYSMPFFTVYDADNDGKTDLVVNAEYHRRIVFLRGLGGGNFAPATVLYDDPGVGGFRAIIPYDVDDDGRPDLLLGNKNSNLTTVNRISWLSGKTETPPPAVTCPRDLLFGTQIEIDSFPIKYPDCHEILGNLIIYEVSANGDPVIYDLSPLQGIHTVHGGVYLYRSYLPNFHGLDSLRSIGKDLEIENGYVLASLEGLGNVHTVGGNLVIRNNQSVTSGQSKLKNLHGLENLERVGGDFLQYERDMLTLEGLQSLRFVGGNLDIRMGNLQTMTGLEQIDTIGKSLIIDDLPNLKSLQGLQNLRHAGLDISSDSLPDLQGLNNWQSGRELRLTGNKLLQSLTGIEHLQTLTGHNSTTPIKPPAIWLADNPVLSDLSALDHTITVDGDGIFILNNTSLSACAAQAICDYLPAPPDTVSIGGNLPGCDSDSAILNACLTVGAVAPSDFAVFQVFPNPVSDGESLTVVWRHAVCGPLNVEFLAMDGRVLKTVVRETAADQVFGVFPVSDIPSGSFMVRVSDGKNWTTRMVLKF